MDFPTDEDLLASAVSFLIEGEEIYEASLLLLCDLETHTWNSYNDWTSLIIELIGSRTVYDIIQNENLPSNEIIKRAFDAVLPRNFGVESVIAHVELTSIEFNWRQTMEEMIMGKGALNQCKPIGDSNRFSWENLYFRSPPEIAIAKVLSEHEVLFLPNCMARLGSHSPVNRKNREADFLVCSDGKWGIIEVDGETIHTVAANDHDRDRLFEEYGIRVIERFTAKKSTSDPEGVVTKFLNILKKNG